MGRWWITALGIFAVSGCAASHHGGSEGERLERRLLLAQCLAELEPECAPRAYYTPTDVERCVEQRWAGVPLRRRDAIDEGRAVIDEDAVEDCIAAMGCTTYWRGVCDHVTIGLTPIGGACAEDESCEPGSFCSRRGGCGTCEPLLAPGEVCRRHEDCAPSDEGEVLCDRLGGNTCLVLSEPVRIADLGGPCGLVTVSDGHAARSVCGEGLICRLPEQECVERTIPDVDPEEIVLVREVGAPCGPTHACDADADLVCTLERICQPFDALEGTWCANSFLCGPELHCAIPSARCVAGTFPDGAPCIYDTDCDSRRCVNTGLRSFCLPRVSC